MDLYSLGVADIINITFSFSTIVAINVFLQQLIKNTVYERSAMVYGSMHVKFVGT